MLLVSAKCLTATKRLTSHQVLAHVGAVVGLEGLVVAVERLHHEVLQGAVLVRGQQLVPAAAPDHLDDVPARALEEGLELLDSAHARGVHPYVLAESTLRKCRLTRLSDARMREGSPICSPNASRGTIIAGKSHFLGVSHGRAGDFL